jgi:predicted esterase
VAGFFVSGHPANRGLAMTDPAARALVRYAPATVQGRYLARPPAGAAANVPAPWLIGFHGQAQSAAVMLEPFAEAAPGEHWLVASVQALHPFPVRSTGATGFNWMMREDRELHIASNIGYVNNVCDQLAAEFGAPSHIVFAGFSQGVAMAYRAALSGARAAAGIISAGGDVPPEYRSPGAATKPWPRVLAATGASDEWYTPARLAEDAALLQAHAPAVTTLTFAGGHEWNAELVAKAREFLAGIAPSPLK